MLFSAVQTHDLLLRHHIPVATTVLAHNWAGVTAAAKKMGFPLVLKVASSDASHKTDHGLVETGISDPTHLKHAFNGLSQKAAPFGMDAFIVQKHVFGVEFLVGGIRDPSFGPAVLFGLGGIFAELFNEVAVRVCPLTIKDARALLLATKARVFFTQQGFRGKKVAIQPVVDLLLKTSTLLENQNIQSLDFNPVIANHERVWVVDARIESLNAVTSGFGGNSK